MDVKFTDVKDVENSLFKYAVIVSCYQNKWIYCKHRDRETWEIPGGHREPAERILDTAKRELYEETGALDYKLFPVCAYCVTSYGLLCFADVKTIGSLPPFEMERIQFFDQEPKMLTYPDIQPYLFDRVKYWLEKNKSLFC